MHDGTLATAPMRALLAQESRMLAPELARAHGSTALLLETAGMPTLLSPLRDTLCACVSARGELVGDLRASIHALPFADGCMDLLVLRHVGEYVADPAALVGEALRVLAVDGVVIIAGIHPRSLWHPWLRHHAAMSNQAVQLASPSRWRTWLAAADSQVNTVKHFGPSFPAQSATRFQGSGLLPAGYILVGSKRGRPPAVVRLKTAPRRLPVGGAVPGTARRECA
ncbi:MAG: class I SAM-dependent methyltransferase [Xanthomonadales bacterium]|nr:class I SAM-dependent methyltransferase [Xanthomonadales bacterium]